MPDGGPWMRYESVHGIGAPKRENDHACKALAYLLLGPYAYMESETREYRHETVSYLTRDAAREPDDFWTEHAAN